MVRHVAARKAHQRLSEFRSPPQKDFYDKIDPERTFAHPRRDYVSATVGRQHAKGTRPRQTNLVCFANVGVSGDLASSQRTEGYSWPVLHGRARRSQRRSVRASMSSTQGPGKTLA